jgi:hypothetical protein
MFSVQFLPICVIVEQQMVIYLLNRTLNAMEREIHFASRYHENSAWRDSRILSEAWTDSYLHFNSLVGWVFFLIFLLSI